MPASRELGIRALEAKAAAAQLHEMGVSSLARR
jgi:hypothetical protein